jgi:pimeloyl-ACP methyl ester carboxylesterase
MVAGTAAALSRQSPAQEPCTRADFQFVKRDLCYISLPCGRRLAYSEIGDANATWTIINHHGLFSGRIDSENCLQLLRTMPGVRVITADRPGMGKSDPDMHCTFLTWPSYIEALANALCIERFAVMGVSDGSPFALAVARAMPERVMVVSLQSPVGPFEFLESQHNFAVFGSREAAIHPAFTSFVINRYADPFLRRQGGIPLRYALSGPNKHIQMAGSAPHIINAYEQGAAPMIHYIAEMRTPWSSWLKEVPTKVKLLYGGKDRFYPPAAVQKMADALPNSELHFYPNDSHATLLVDHVADRLHAALPPV